MTAPTAERTAAERAADPYGTAVEIVTALRAAGFATDTEQERQVMALAEEGGELLGAVRRHLGYASRNSWLAGLSEEAADVLLSTNVTAVVLGVIQSELAYCVAEIPTRRRRRDRPAQQALDLFASAGLAAATWMRVAGAPPAAMAERMRWPLAEVLVQLDLVAAHLGIDLRAATEAKAEVIFTRGWMDPR